MRDIGPREGIAFLVVGLFAYALWMNPTDKLMLGALIASFSTAVGFYLGGSKVGTDTATKNADTVAANASAALVTPADVTIVNDPNNPVPVKEPKP